MGSSAMAFTLVKSAVLCAVVTFSLGSRLDRPYVESYWESWNYKDYPTDYAALLKDVPASALGSTKGVNMVEMSFGDYSGGLGGLEAPEDVIREGIEAVHAAGGLVKMAFGGALYSMSEFIRTEEDAVNFCINFKETCDEYGIDGMDLDIEDGGTNADIQFKVISECRKQLGPAAHISYTLPALSSTFAPWSDTIRRSIEFLDAINIMAYDVYWTGYEFDLDVQGLHDLGVPNSKIVYGVMPGHHDAGNEYTTLDDAIEAANYVKTNGLAGIMTWSINRDTDQRMQYGAGEDNLYQTGKPDATYIDTVSNQLNA